MRILINEIKSLWKNQFALNTPKEISDNLTKDDYIKIEEARCKSNIQRMISMCFVIIIIQTVNLLSAIYTDFHNGFKMEFSVASGLLLLICLLYLIIIKCFHEKAKNITIGKIIYRSFWGFYVIGSLVFCYFDLIERGALTNYVLLMTILSVIPLLNWKEMLSLSGTGLITQCMMVYSAGEYFQLCITVAILAFVVSHMLYTSFVTVHITHKQLENMAETDSLTNLFNRRGFDKRLSYFWKQSLRNHSKVTVAMIDIDFFKNFNDKFGHAAGDQCLIEIAKSIAKDIKRETDLVARYGGEEFIVFSTDLTDEKTIEFMNRITARVEGLQIAAGHTSVSPYVTVSIGAVSAQAAYTLSFDQLYRQADQELANAKHCGKNAFSFNGTIYRNKEEAAAWSLV